MLLKPGIKQHGQMPWPAVVKDLQPFLSKAIWLFSRWGWAETRRSTPWRTGL